MKVLRAPFRVRGTVHPHYHKEVTAGRLIETLPPPTIVQVPMLQHLGAPAKPIVSKGDKVGVGQLIAEAGGPVSACAHSPVSGTVRAITEGVAATGRPTLVIEIENDGLNTPASPLQPKPDWSSQEPATLIGLVAAAGIVGMGGAGFPTHVKINPPPAKRIDTLIINGAECEPYLTADHRLMVERPEAIWEGIRILRHILRGPRVRLAIEDNKPDAIRAMEKVMASADDDVALVVLPTAYPMGAEKQLIAALLGREVPSGGLPSDVGALVENVATCAAVFEAVVQGHPLTRRVVTVTGSLIRRPANVLAPIGARFSDLIEFCGGLQETGGKLICGGPMMGVAQVDASTPVGKTVSGILALSRQDIAVYETHACIACGRCVRACPMSLLPCTISVAVEAGQFEEAERLAVMDCIECGCCAYVCPAHRPMVQFMRQGKAQIQAIRRLKQQQNPPVPRSP